MDRSMQVEVARSTPMAKPASAADAPTRALPAPRARDEKVSLGLAKDTRFDYFTVRSIPSHVGRMRKAPWASFKTTQTVTKAMFRRVGSQASRA
jgi:hypothetical protein